MTAPAYPKCVGCGLPTRSGDGRLGQAWCRPCWERVSPKRLSIEPLRVFAPRKAS